jgi:hypothetical protein
MTATNKRDYKQEKKTARRRGETDSGANSGDNKRNKDRAKHEKSNGKIAAGKELHHSGRGGSGSTSVISKSSNRADGGKKGNKAGKAAGGRKGNKAGKAAGGAKSSRKGVANKKTSKSK